MTEIAGWLSDEIAEAMRSLILITKPSVCVEIGVFAGKSLINTALALRKNKRGVVYGIDPWKHEEAMKNLADNECQSVWKNMDLDQVHSDCMREIWSKNLERYVVIIRSASRYASELFEEDSVDILYIDGGHSEEASLDDVTAYLGTVIPYGHIWLDDTSWPSLQKAVSVLKSHCNLVKDFGTCHLYQKR